MPQWTWRFRYLCKTVISFLRINTLKWDSGLYDTFIFSILRNLHTAFHSDGTNLHSHNSAQGFPFLHILANTWYFLSFLIIAILTDMSWYLVVALICIYLMIMLLSTYLYTCWPSIYLFTKISREILCPFFNWLWIIFCLKLYVFFLFCILALYQICSVFSHTVGCLFIWLMVSFAVQSS